MNVPRAESAKYRTPLQIDPATGIPVCARCWADIRHRHPSSRYCSYECRNRSKAKRQRERMWQ